MFAVVVGSAVPVQAQQPTFATSKVEGTDNVYIFRYQGHQSVFVVTPAGVIATDPIGLGRQLGIAWVEYGNKLLQHSHFADSTRTRT
jgi:hypothetical protein